MNADTHPLYKVSLKVLEDWAMMLVDPVEGSTKIFDLNAPLMMSEVNVHGAFNGTIAIVAQKDFTRLLATNLLGDENSADDRACSDAFCEMGNVLAGNFLTEIYGNDVAFDVLNPHVREISANQFEELARAPQSYFFRADEAPVCVTFNIVK
ncbi:MAG: chemotaxis protein CheX [Oligoflexia bacterium]|nr:chemotaxis protein CheX [Oligoflexia bacterium]